MMAVYHVKTTGTKTSGASISGDWSDSNCYADFNDALIASDADDTVILDDEDHTINAPAAVGNWNENKTVQSRGGDPTACSLSVTSGDEYVLDIGPGSGSNVVVNLAGFKISCTTTRTADKALLRVGQVILTELNVTDCIIGDVTINAVGGTRLLGGLFSNSSTSNRKINFIRCKFADVTATTDTKWLVLIAFAAPGSPTYAFDDCEFSNWDITYANDVDSVGALYCNQPGEITFNDCTFKDIIVTGGHQSLIYMINAGTTIEMTGITVQRITRTGSPTLAGGAFALFKCPFTVRDVYAEDVHSVIPETNNGGDGTLFYQSTGATGTFRDIEVHRCDGRSGNAIFCSNGASLDCENIRAYNCRTAVGVIYLGYNGDAKIRGVLIKDCEAYSATAQHAQANGLALYCRINAAAPARDATYEISNITLLNNVNSGTLNDGMTLENHHATSSVTAMVNNAIIRNGNGRELRLAKNTGTGSLNVTTTAMNIEGGTNSVSQDDGTNTTWISNDLTSDDPGLNADGSLSDESALIGSGVKYWTGENPVGADGEPIADWSPSIGAMQSRAIPFHPSNL